VNVRALVRKIRKKFLALDPAFAAIVVRDGVGYCWREAWTLSNGATPDGSNH
jgi:hypothetical protein